MEGNFTLQAEKLSKSINGRQRLFDVSFDIAEKECVGILGRSGSGKSILMSILTGCVMPDSGSVYFSGKKLETRSAKLFFGYVPSKSLLYEDMSVNAYLRFSARLKGIAEKKLNEKVILALKRVHAEYLLNSKIEDLTKYERKLVEFAQAVIAEPYILLVDAPTSELTPNEKERIRALLRELKDDYAILLASSELYEVTEICSRVIILSSGRIAADRKTSDFSKGAGENIQIRLRIKGNQEEILNTFAPFEAEAEKVIFYFEKGEEIGTYNVFLESKEDLRERVFKLCAKSGLVILEMRRTSVSPEDIYLRLTGDTQA